MCCPIMIMKNSFVLKYNIDRPCVDNECCRKVVINRNPVLIDEAIDILEWPSFVTGE